MAAATLAPAAVETVESVDAVLDVLAAAAQATLGDPCPPAPEGACFVCDAPLREVLIVPCVAGCCDRGLCLDCGASLGYPID